MRSLLLSNTPDAYSDLPVALLDVLGRLGLSLIFLLSGLNKIQNYEANASYMASGGLPAEWLPAVILLEVGGALFMLVGFQTRLVALAFAGFSLLTAVLFHSNPDDSIQYLMFLKNVAIAGGFLILAAHGAGRFSVDAWRVRRTRG